MQKRHDAATREKYHLYCEHQEQRFRQQIRKYLASEQITATALSRKCDLADGAITAMLHNEQFIRRNHVSRIAKVTGITEEELVGPEPSCPEPVPSPMWDAPRVTTLLDAIGQKRQTQRRLADEIDAILTDVERIETQIATLETEMDYLLVEASALVKGQDWMPDGEPHALAT